MCYLQLGTTSNNGLIIFHQHGDNRQGGAPHVRGAGGAGGGPVHRHADGRRAASRPPLRAGQQRVHAVSPGDRRPARLPAARQGGHLMHAHLLPTPQGHLQGRVRPVRQLHRQKLRRFQLEPMPEHASCFGQVYSG